MTDVVQTTDRTTTPWWKATWPLGRTESLQLLAALVAVIIGFVVLGELLTNWTAPNAIVDLDTRTAEDLASSRTTTGDELASWSVFLANTPVKIGLSFLIAGWALWRWRRWYEAALIGVTLAFEATAYFTTSRIVGRDRPDVERLIDSPVDTSFPSGHVAAATVYAVLAIIVIQRTESTRARLAAIVLAGILPLAVAWGRMYQGMHFLSDVVAGTILGIVSIVICHRVLRPHQPDVERSMQ